MTYRVTRSSGSPRNGELQYELEPLVVEPVVPGPKVTDTGLVDQFGNTIVRTQPPIGFGRNDEW